MAELGQPDERLAAELHRSKQQHYRDRLKRGEVPLRPGVVALASEAAAAGLQQWIVTTSGRAAVAALLQSSPELSNCFGGWICGDDVQRKKPDPEAYQLALRHLKLPTAEVLAIEDSPQGLMAANGAGLEVVITTDNWSGGAQPCRSSLGGGASRPRACHSQAAQRPVFATQPPLQNTWFNQLQTTVGDTLGWVTKRWRDKSVALIALLSVDTQQPTTTLYLSLLKVQSLGALGLLLKLNWLRHAGQQPGLVGLRSTFGSFSPTLKRSRSVADLESARRPRQASDKRSLGRAHSTRPYLLRALRAATRAFFSSA